MIPKSFMSVRYRSIVLGSVLAILGCLCVSFPALSEEPATDNPTQQAVNNPTPKESQTPKETPRKKAEIPTPTIEAGGASVEAVADDLEYFRDEKKVVGRGNVSVTQKDVRLMADQAEVFTETKKSYAQGHVTLMQKNLSLSGEKGYYDFYNHQGSFPQGKITVEPFYVFGDQIEQVSKTQINIYQATVTTCPLPHPHYDIKADRAIVYPNDKLIAWNVKFRILGTPVFWWPYLVVPLNNEAGPFELSAGQSKNFGNYFLIGKVFPIIPKTEGREVTTKFHVDHYAKRGTGLGDDTWYHFDGVGDGYLKYYSLKDARAPDPFAMQEDGIWRKKERKRITWKHRTDFDQYTNLIAQWNKYSDEHFFHTFFQKEFDQEPVPQSFVTFTRNVKNYGILVDVQRQANDFDNVLERLPEVKFTINPTQIKGTDYFQNSAGLFYSSQTGYVNYHRVNHNITLDPNDESQKRRIVTETTSHESRVDSFHELTYPVRLLRYYDFTPNANSRWTYYNHNATGKQDLIRNQLGLGINASTRFYRIFDIEKGSILGMKANRIRHIVKPYYTYTSIRKEGTRPGHLLQFDGIDGLKVSDIMQFGVENRIQTKVNDQRIDVVSLNTYVNYVFNDGNSNSRFQTGNVELVLRPYSWLLFRSETAIDLKQHRKTGHVADAVIKTKYLDLQFNHRYVKTTSEDLTSDFFFQKETNVLTFNGVIHLNDRWDIGGYTRWDVRRHSFREYEWRLSRDLHDWIVNFGQNIRHTDINWLNHTLFLELQLKAIPGVGYSTGTRAEFADARIGETVSGANVAPPPPSLIK